MGRIPAKPQRRYPGIGFVWSEGQWKARARVTRDGQEIVGPLRASQEEALLDREEMKKERLACAPLGKALDAVVAHARKRGLPEATVRGNYINRKRVLLQAFSPDDPLVAIDADEVLAFIRFALEGGELDNPRAGQPGQPDKIRFKPRKAKTIAKGYLNVLHQAFELEGLRSPVPEAKNLAKSALRDGHTQMPWFLPEELRSIVSRMRASDAPAAARDADIVTLIACTAIRDGELHRARVRDINLDRGELVIPKPKFRSKPRTQLLPEPAVEAARRLVQGKKPSDLLVNSPSEMNTLWERWKRRLKEPRLNGRALRRSQATGLLLRGATLTDVREQLGHTHNSTETLRYLEAVEKHRKDHVRRASQMKLSGRLRNTLRPRLLVSDGLHEAAPGLDGHALQLHAPADQRLLTAPLPLPPGAHELVRGPSHRLARVDERDGLFDHSRVTGRHGQAGRLRGGGL